MTDLDVLGSLQTKITDHTLRVRRHEAYYNGELRLAALGLSLPPEMAKLQTVVNWPRLVADALEERIDLTGFRMGNTAVYNTRLWGWWQANNLDEESSLAHLEALVQGRAYIVIGFNEDDPSTPIITCESAKHMHAEVDPRTHKVTSAARVYGHNSAGEPQNATLYMPTYTVYYERDNGRWVETDFIQHNYGIVPVVPMVNRARLSDRAGRSEMADVIGITDACCRAVTDLQGAQELLAVPSRYIFGIEEDDLKDTQGNPVTKWEAYIGRFNALGNESASVVQLPAADLRNFTEIVNLYARLVASLSGMPPHYVGLSTDNPASADAIRSGEARHVKRAERKCRVFGGAWEEVMRVALQIVDGVVPDEAKSMESVFADAATPTYAAKVDAVVKLFGAKNGAGETLLPREAAWEELGYSPEKIARLTELTQADPTDALLSALGLGTSNGAATPGRSGGAQLDGLTGTAGTSPASTGGTVS